MNVKITIKNMTILLLSASVGFILWLCAARVLGWPGNDGNPAPSAYPTWMTGKN